MSDMSGAQGEDQPRTVGSFLISHLNIRGQQQRGILGIRFQHFKNNLWRPPKHLILQLTFRDSQVADFLEEMGAFLEGYLALIDAVSRDYSYNRILRNSGVTLYVEMKG